MNAREALKTMQACLHPGAMGYCQEAIAILSIALDERSVLATACGAIIREGDPYTATQDWPDPALFAEWAIGQARVALAKTRP